MSEQINLADIHKKAVLIYSVGRAMLSAGAFCAVEAAATLGTWPYMTTCAYWCSGLTLGIREAIKNGMKYVIACDGDTVFNWRHVAYLYTMAELHPHMDAIASLQVKRQSNAMLWDIRKAGEEKLPDYANGPITELMPATIAHFGLTIIRTDALTAVPQPWFLRLADPARPGESTDEDVYFWRQWTANGRTLFVAPRCPVGHVQEFVTLPSEDMKPIHQLWADYHTTGKTMDGTRKTSWELADEIAKGVA